MRLGRILAGSERWQPDLDGGHSGGTVWYRFACFIDLIILQFLGRRFSAT